MNMRIRPKRRRVHGPKLAPREYLRGERRPAPWVGSALALTGILLVAANLRSAVAALSPIIPSIRVDYGLGTFTVGAIGMLPPFCFAVFSVATLALARRFGTEKVLVASLAALVIGHGGRGIGGSELELFVFSSIVFAGLGAGNVLLPPLVKKYFPRNVGVVTSLYATVIPIGTLVPPLIAAPVAGAWGWRVSLGMWAILAVIAIVPWLWLIISRPVGSGTFHRAASGPWNDDRRRVRRSRTAWGLAALFAISALNAYSLFAWLPLLLVEVVGIAPAEAGAVLSLFAAIGIPAGIIVPLLASRLTGMTWLISVCLLAFTIGYIGLLTAPGSATWLWAVLAGIGQFLFPLVLVLIGLRSATHSISLAMSGFVQGVGYGVGALGPLAVGLLREMSGSWTAPLAFLLITTLVLGVAATILLGRANADSAREVTVTR